MRFPLCTDCFSRNNGNPNASKAKLPADCAICHGAFEKIHALAASALSQANFEWRSFFLSSKIPAEWQIAEEDVWDSTPSRNWQSLKNNINHDAVAAISASGKQYLPRNADAQITFDFASGAALASPLPLFILSHYNKHSRELAQSLWHCGGCKGRGCKECNSTGIARDSVERVLADAAKSAFGAEGAKLHASGREDIDVLMKGNGRPFVLEVIAPKIREKGIAKFGDEVNSTNLVSLVGGARKVGGEYVELVCNSHFYKEYEAIVMADRPFCDADFLLLDRKSFSLSQQTPIRVLNRRADLVRTREISVLCATAGQGGSMRLHVLAEAGSYIKEFINSDGGRTSPSVSSLLFCRVQCKELNVIRIHDGFIETCGL
jgi:tRNA pseudouridine synthase 10